MPNHTEENNLKSISIAQGYGFVDSFSGAGGISAGLQRAGINLLLAFDNNKCAVETHDYNNNGKCFCWDVTQISGKNILDIIERSPGQLDLFAGGPPCQGFSKQKRGAHEGDVRNDLILEFIRLVSEILPRTFFFENVAIFGQKRGRKYLEVMRNSLANYILYPYFYNCADYGLAQTRQRFIVVGVRIDLGVVFSKPPVRTKLPATIKSIIGDLPEPPDDFSVHPNFPNHQRARVSQANINRFSHVPQGGGWESIPWDLRLPCHKKVDRKSGGWPDVFGRLEWEGQCPTITGGFDSFTRGRYGHPIYDRPLTPREAARLQGFNDDYIFLGTRGDVRSQIGNAVPPPLAEYIGLEIIRCLATADGIIDAESSHELEPKQLNLLSLCN